jgi:hypothetical protein
MEEGYRIPIRHIFYHSSLFFLVGLLIFTQYETKITRNNGYVIFLEIIGKDTTDFSDDTTHEEFTL